MSSVKNRPCPLLNMSPIATPIPLNGSSVEFCDLPELVKNEIFQNFGIFKLLILRRVCKSWKSYISNESAPFMRTVAVPLGPLYSSLASHDREKYLKAWSSVRAAVRASFGLAKKASTILMFEDPAKAYTNSQWSFDKCQIPYSVWTEYNKQATADDRTRLINKAIYANTLIDSQTFLHMKVNQHGFHTVLYQCDLNFAATSTLFRFKPAKNFRLARLFNHAPLYLEVSGMMSFVQKELDVRALKTLDKTRLPSAAATYFASHGATALRQDQVADTIKGHDVLKLGKSEQVRLLVKQLLQRFDPKNTQSLEHYSDGNLLAFTETAHPLLSILLDHYVKAVTAKSGRKCDCGECPIVAKSLDSSDEEGSGYDDQPFSDDEDEKTDDQYYAQMMSQFLLKMMEITLN